MKFDPSDVHIVLIGCDRVLDYRINLEILRYNFSFGDKLWITTVFNGDQNELPSGIGENSFIYLDENRGYGLGALDSFNAGLGYASLGYRPIVMIFNFDVWFYTEKGFEKCVQDFLDSDKQFSAGYLPDHDLFMTDCIIFKKELLSKILPIEDDFDTSRANDPKLLNLYTGTELGFMNMEEFFLNSFLVSEDIEENKKNGIYSIGRKMKRDGAPRYRWTQEYFLAHEHDYELRKEMLRKYGVVKGNIIKEFLK